MPGNKPFDVIVGLLPLLSHDEKYKLLALLNDVRKSQLVDRYKASVSVTSDLYDCMADFLYKVHHTKKLPYNIFKERSQKLCKRLDALEESLNEYLDNIIEDAGRAVLPSKKILRKKFYKLYCHIVGTALIKAPGIPLAFTTFINWGDRFPGLLDASFPGYVQSGLILTVILDKIDKKSEGHTSIKF